MRSWPSWSARLDVGQRRSPTRVRGRLRPRSRPRAPHQEHAAGQPLAVVAVVQPSKRKARAGPSPRARCAARAAGPRARPRARGLDLRQRRPAPAPGVLPLDQVGEARDVARSGSGSSGRRARAGGTPRRPARVRHSIQVSSGMAARSRPRPRGAARRHQRLQELPPGGEADRAVQDAQRDQGQRGRRERPLHDARAAQP